MAGDWLKLEHVTPDKPEVYQIAGSLGVSPEDAFGRCVRIWIWADQQSLDGHAMRVTKMTLDALARRDGFATAMLSAGWLIDNGDGSLTIPNFERHNGETAKKRAQARDRKQKQRAGHTELRHDAVSQPSRRKRDNEVTREEKRREPSLRSGKRAGAPSIDKLTIPDWIDPDVWMKFVAHRNKTAKTRLTPAAVEILIEKLTKAKGFGHDPNEMIKDAIANGYQGVVFDRHLQPARKGAQAAPPADLEKLWDEAIASFSKFGPGQSVVFSDPRIRPAIEAVFGDYHNFKTCSQRDLDFRKPQFINAVRAHP